MSTPNSLDPELIVIVSEWASLLMRHARKAAALALNARALCVLCLVLPNIMRQPWHHANTMHIGWLKPSCIDKLGSSTDNRAHTCMNTMHIGWLKQSCVCELKTPLTRTHHAHTCIGNYIGPQQGADWCLISCSDAGQC